MNSIEAGRAYITVTCNNSELKKSLQEIKEKVAETSRAVSVSEGSLSPRVEVSGSENFIRQLKQIRSTIEKTAESVAKKPIAANFTVTAGDVYSGVKSAVAKLSSMLGTTGDMFEKMAGRTGVSSTALSEYAHAAQMCGADITNVEGALKSMQAQTLAAANGVKKSAETFNRLGIDVEAFRRLSPEAQFDELARAVASIEDPTIRAAEAMKIFGGDGQKLLPLFNSGANGLKDLREEARKLGLSIDDQSAKMGADFVDATTRLKGAVQGAGLAVAKVFNPYVVKAANVLSECTAKVSQFVDAHPRLTLALVGSASVVAACAAGYITLTKTMNTVQFAMAKLSAAANTLKIVFASLKAGGFFAAPGVGGWLALGTAIVVAATALRSYISERGKYKFSDDAQNNFDQGEQERTEDKSSLDRLKTLEKISRQHKLSNEQVLEAVRLAADLKAKYGDVGISVDAVTGKIEGAEQAQAKLNAMMMEAKRAELQAALAEAEANGGDDGLAIARKMAKEEVSDTELAIGKKRGESWGSYFSHYEKYRNNDDARLAILENDENFQKRLEAAKQKNAALVQSYKTQLDAINKMTQARAAAPQAQDNEQDETTEEELATRKSAIKRGSEIAASFIRQEEPEPTTALEREIKSILEKRNKAIEELKELADPEGLVDWNDAAQVDALYQHSETARELQRQALDIDASTQRLIEAAKQKDAAAKQQEQDAKRDAAEKQVADYEKSVREEGMSDLQRQMNVIDETTEKYKEQLAILKEIALESGDLTKAGEIDVKMNEADKSAIDRKSAIESKALTEAQTRLFERYATPEQKLVEAQKELQAAVNALYEAKNSGDKLQIAEAMNRLGEAQDKYDNSVEASKSITRSVKSLGGTFDAWQAASLTNRATADKKLYDETRLQTRYLAEISRKIGAAVFG